MQVQGQTRPKKKNAGKKKQPVHNSDIVFTKNGSIQTVPPMAKRLNSVMDPVIGLQYVWEYRSPTKSVAPHYQCKLCKVQLLQNEMIAHITGWKHSFRYLKRGHAEKVPHEEEDATKNADIRKAIRMTAAEVEKAEGRGQVKVVIKEPGEVVAFQNMKSAFPTAGGLEGAGLLGPAPRARHPGELFGSGYPEPLLPPRGGLMSDFPSSMHNDVSMRGGLSSAGQYRPDRFMGGPDSMQSFPSRPMGSDGFRMDSQSEIMGKPYPENLLMDSNTDRTMGSKDPDRSSTLGTLLGYLDKFRIECEDDAQIVLKITQKLTDVLMEYRLRSIPTPSIRSLNPNPLPSRSLSDMNFSSHVPQSSSDQFSNNPYSSDRFSSNPYSSDRFSNNPYSSDRFSNMSGPSRFFN